MRRVVASGKSSRTCAARAGILRVMTVTARHNHRTLDCLAVFGLSRYSFSRIFHDPVEGSPLMADQTLERSVPGIRKIDEESKSEQKPAGAKSDIGKCLSVIAFKSGAVCP